MSGRRFSTSAISIFVASLFLLSLFTSCGSSSSNSISNAQAQAISQEFVMAVQSALTNSFTGASVPAGAHERLSKIIREADPETASGCTPTSNGQTCSFPISYTGTCPSGGTISVSGDFNLTLNSSGTGSDNSSLTITPANCVVSNLTVNGDPSVTLATAIAFTNDIFDYPVTMNESGGISYGPHPSGSCTMNVSLTLEQSSCSVSGTVCGHSVSGSC